VSAALLALPFGLGIGLLLGLVGGGGSVLAVPVPVYVLDQPAKEATTESLLVVGTAALVGAVDHARIGRVQMRTALAFGAAGGVGAIAGTALNRLISGEGCCSPSPCCCSPPPQRCCSGGRTLLSRAATPRSHAWELSVSARVS